MPADPVVPHATVEEVDHKARGRRAIALFWHIHQPFFVPDEEVAEQVAESYAPLLELHERLGVPFSLNVSGGLLVRLEKSAPALIERWRRAVEDGVVEIVSSGAYHPMLPLLPLERARRQVAFDVEAKRRVLGCSPRGFWPADLGFSQSLVPLLAEARIEWTVVDGAARVLGSSLPGWEPKERFGQAILSPRIRPLLFEAELGRGVSVRVGETRIVALARHPALTWQLIDLETGVLHHPENRDAFLGNLTNYWASGADLCVLGDDGERLNGRTLRCYEELVSTLAETGVEFVLGSTAVESALGSAEEVYLPTATFLVDFEAWLSTADDFVCFRALDELHQELRTVESFARLTDDRALLAELEGIGDSLLRIEDSSFYFWKFLRRTREPFLERIHGLRRRLIALRSSGGLRRSP